MRLDSVSGELDDSDENDFENSTGNIGTNNRYESETNINLKDGSMGQGVASSNGPIVHNQLESDQAQISTENFQPNGQKSIHALIISNNTEHKNSNQFKKTDDDGTFNGGIEGSGSMPLGADYLTNHSKNNHKSSLNEIKLEDYTEIPFASALQRSPYNFDGIRSVENYGIKRNGGLKENSSSKQNEGSLRNVGSTQNGRLTQNGVTAKNGVSTESSKLRDETSQINDSIINFETSTYSYGLPQEARSCSGKTRAAVKCVWLDTS